MSDAATLVRTSGLALALAGVAYLPLALGGWSSIADVGSDRWWLVLSASTVHHFLLLFGLFGLLVAQLGRARLLGTVAFTVASLGNAIVGAIGLVQLTILPALGGHPSADDALICTPFYPAATQAATAFIEQACASWDFGALAAWVGGGRIALAIGSILVGITIVRARVLPVAAGFALALGWVIQLVGFVVPLPSPVTGLAYLAVAGAYVACGVSLLAGVGAGMPGAGAR
jgi:hypothetical protein